ncbi:MAG TPA: PAS domain S-box protein [Phycisphaerae bacterium]|nr:PAS domain S-box protein [Phycisphaerae bacterium]
MQGWPLRLLPRSIRAAAWLCILITLAISALDLVGWVSGVALLKSIRSQWIPMKVITALCMVLCAAELALLQKSPQRGRKLILLYAPAMLVCLVGLLTIVVYAIEMSAGQEASLAKAPFLKLFLAPPGRMALLTGVLFVVIGSALSLLASGGQRAADIAHGLVFPAAMASYLVPVSYILGVVSIHEWLQVPVALNTGIAFCAICIAVFCIRPDTWLMSVFTGGHAGGIMARRLLPGLVLLPVVIGWLRLYGERVGAFESEVGVVLVAVTYTICLLLLVWGSARSVGRTDEKRRAAERALRESEHKHRVVADNTYDFEFWLDPQGHCIYASPACERVYGFGQAEFMADPTLRSRTIHPEDRARYEGHLRTVEAAHSCGEGEFRIMRRDGSIRWIGHACQPVSDEQGRYLGVRGSNRDITDRKRAEEALRESEERLRFALETSHTGAWDMDLVNHTAFRSLEHDRVFGYAELLPQWTYEMFLEHVLPEDRAEVDAKFRHAMDTRGDWSFECRIRRADGEVRWISAAGRHRADTADGQSRMAGIVQDITERKQAEEALRESEERVRRKLDSVLSPEGDLGNLELADIIDIPAVQSLLEDFYEVARIPMAILDLKGKVLIGVGWQDICTKFHRVNPQTCQNCVESDLRLSAGIPDGECRLYKCRNNLWDMATPILVGGRHLGNLFAGQFFFEDEEPDYEMFRSQARQYGFDEQQYISALDAAPRLNRRLVDTGMEFFIKLAGLVSHLSYGSVKLARLLAEHERIQDRLLRQTAQLEEQTRIADLASLFIRDLGSRVVYWNTGARQLYGFTREEAVGRASHELLQTVFPEPLEQIEAKFFAEGRWAGELTHTRRDGTKITVSSYWVLHKDAEGRPQAVLEVNNDITAAKEAERALRESRERFRLLSEVSAQLLETDDPQALVESLCGKVMAHLDCHIFVNYLVDEQAHRLHLNATGGLPEKTAKAIEWLDFGQAICGRVAQEGKRIIAEHIQESCDARADLVRSFGIRAYACHPLFAQGRVIGTLSFGTKARPTFRPEQLEVMKTVADQVAVAMQRVLAEQALRELNETLEQRIGERTRELQLASAYNRSLIEASLDPLVTIDADGKVTDVNAATEKATGRSRRELIGTDFCDYFTEPEKARAGYQQVFREGAVQDYALEVRRRDGHVTPVLYNASIYMDEAGKVIGVFAAARDVTAARAAQEALRRASAYNRSLIEASLDPLVTIDADGKITDVNAATEKVTGRTREELVGTDFSDYFTEPDKARAGYQQVFRDGFVQDYALEIQHPDGHRTPVLYNASVYQDEAGKVIGVFAAARDITQQKRAEEAVRLERQRLHQLFEQLPVYVILLTPDHYVPYANRYFRERFGESYGRRCYEYLFGRSEPCEICETFTVLKTNQPHTWEWVGPDGRNYDIFDFPFTDSDGSPMIMEMGIDVTEQKRLQRELQQANEELERRVAARTAELQASNKELEAFAYSVSHDLRAPLRAMDGFSQALLEDYPQALDVEGRGHLNRIRAASQRMGELIDGILGLSRTTRSEMRPVAVNMSDLARTVAADLRKSDPSRQAEFVIEPQLVVNADANLLRIMLENLLGNAWKFTGKHARARIEVGKMRPEEGGARTDSRTSEVGPPTADRTSDGGDETVYFVRDDGAGFDMKYAHNLFGAFRRLHSMTEFEGTGVGLATVQRIVHRHGGRIWAEGQIERGATFYFTIPEEPRRTWRAK